MDIKSESTCENQSLSLSNSNFDQAKAQEMLITPYVLDPLTPHSSGWDHQILKNLEFKLLKLLKNLKS